MNDIGHARTPRKGLGWVLLSVFALGFLFPFLTGCSALENAGGFLVRKTPTVVRAAQTNVVERVSTNWVTHTAYVTNLVTLVESSTNAQTGVITPAVIQPQVVPLVTRQAEVRTNLEVVYQPAVVVTNLSLAPTVTGAVSVAGDLAPVPWAGGAASLLLAAAGSVLGFLNHRKAKKALGEKETWQSTARVVVGNFEDLRKAAMKLPGYTPELDTRIMRVVEGAQYAAGVKDSVAKLVDSETGDTVPENFYGVPQGTPPATSFERPNKPLADVLEAAKSGADLKPTDFSTSDWALILRARGLAV